MLLWPFFERRIVSCNASRARESSSRGSRGTTPLDESEAFEAISHLATASPSPWRMILFQLLRILLQSGNGNNLNRTMVSTTPSSSSPPLASISNTRACTTYVGARWRPKFRRRHSFALAQRSRILHFGTLATLLRMQK